MQTFHHIVFAICEYFNHHDRLFPTLPNKRHFNRWRCLCGCLRAEWLPWMQMTRKLLRYLCKFKGIDTSLFEDDAEWELAEAIFRCKLSDSDIQRLESIASKISK